MSKSISLGVIGGGQLGSLLCAAAKKLKVKSTVLSDDKEVQLNIFVIILFIASMRIMKN